MAHFAELNNENIVIRVIVVHNNELLNEESIEVEQLGIDFCVAHYGGRWLQTSYNGNFRGSFAGVGYLYDPIKNEFVGVEVSYESPAE